MPEPEGDCRLRGGGKECSTAFGDSPKGASRFTSWPSLPIPLLGANASVFLSVLTTVPGAGARGSGGTMSMRVWAA